VKLLSLSRSLLASVLTATFALAAEASPIQYTLTVPYADVVLGGTSYAYQNYSTRFVFVGDDSNVIHSLLAGPNILFAAIYQGTASVQILDGSNVIANATFLPNQIVVSADLNNGGLGFGFVPGGIPASGLDVAQLQPLYPMSITNYGRGSFGYDNNYDLTLAFAADNAGLIYPEPATWPAGLAPFGADGSADIFGAVFSCNGFSGFLYAPGCTLGAPLQTDLGAFTIGPLVSLQGLFVSNPGLPMVGEFTARALPTNAVAEPTAPSLAAMGLLALAAVRGRRHVRGLSTST
jgi:hypothetical protein